MFDKNFYFFIKNILNLDLEHDIIFIKNHELRYIYGNSQFCKLFGITLEELIGKDDSYILTNQNFIDKCKESDLYAIKNNFFITQELVNGVTYKVLKLKINLEDNNLGLLCFAKVT